MKAFLDALPDQETAAIVAAMKEVAAHGVTWARHLRGDIYEVRAQTERRAFRILFAREARFILLSLSGFTKKTSKTPQPEIALAETRLAAWRARGRRLIS